MPVVGAAHTADDMSQGNARRWSEFTPARLMRLRAVRRRSCRDHPLVDPDALSNARLNLENPLIGVLPSVGAQYKVGLGGRQQAETV